MDTQMWLNMIFNVVGGLSIFLLGMHNMSNGMQAIAGSRLRKMIGAVADNRVLACGTGAMVTSLIQSSSVTTVMTLGFVNAGVMTLLQAIGIILGADIGTTITGWIVSLNIAKYGLPILGVSGFFFLFTKNERVRYTAMMVMGVGMVFFGLALMKNGLEPLKHSEGFIAWFSRYKPDTYFGVLKCVLTGALVTAIVQSSSATVAITMTLAASGVIDFEIAVALVLGENIGTTVTAFLASLGASTNAKRVAYAHILIKVIGVTLMSFVFFWYIDLLEAILSSDLDIKKRIAFSHTMFNIFIVCLFLPLRDYLANFLIKIVPDKVEQEPLRLTHLDVRMLDTPIIVIEQSRKEILHMGEDVHRMFRDLNTIIKSEHTDEALVKDVFHREEILDNIQKEISTFLVGILSGDIPHNIVIEARAQIRIADEYESVSDYIADILKLYLKLKKAEVSLTEKKKRDLLELHERTECYFSLVDKALASRNVGILPKATIEADAISHQFREFRTIHLKRITDNKIDPLLTISFLNMINFYRRIRDHVLNIAEAIAGEK